MKINKLIIIVSIFLIILNIAQSADNTCTKCFNPTTSICSQLDQTKVCTEKSYSCCAGTISERKTCTDLGGTCYSSGKKCLGSDLDATCDSNQKCCSVNKFEGYTTQKTKVYTFCSNPAPEVQDVCNQIEKYNTLAIDIDGKEYSYLNVIYGSINPDISAQALYSQAEGFQKIASLRKSYLYPSAEEPFLAIEKQYMDISGFSITYGESSLHGQFLAIITKKTMDYFYNYKVILSGGQTFFTFSPENQRLYTQGGYDSITRNDNLNLPSLFAKLGSTQFKAIDIQRVELQVYSSNELNSNALFTKTVDFGAKTASEILGYSGSTTFQSVNVDTRGISIQMIVDPKDQDYFYQFKIVTNSKAYTYPETGRLTKADLEASTLILSKYYNSEKPIKIILNAYVSSTSLSPVYTVEKILDTSALSISYKDQDCQTRCNEQTSIKQCSKEVCDKLPGCKTKDSGTGTFSNLWYGVKNYAFAACVSTEVYTSTSSGYADFIQNLKNLGYWKYIEQIANDPNYGKEIAAMVVGIMSKESGGNKNAVAWSGAGGLMGFMPETAYQFNLCNNKECSERDDRYNPEKAIIASAQLVKEIYSYISTCDEKIKDEMVYVVYNSGTSQGFGNCVCTKLNSFTSIVNQITGDTLRCNNDLEAQLEAKGKTIEDRAATLNSFVPQVIATRNCAYQALGGTNHPDWTCTQTTSVANVKLYNNNINKEFCNEVANYVTSNGLKKLKYYTLNNNKDLILEFGNGDRTPEAILNKGSIAAISSFSTYKKTVYIHEKALPFLLCAEQEIIATCKGADLSYNIKGVSDFMSGKLGRTIPRSAGSTCPESGRCGRHLFGTAIDINPLQGNDDCTKPATCKHDLPQCYVDAFKKYGFRWGGDSFGERTDYMHFDLALSSSEFSTNVPTGLTMISTSSIKPTNPTNNDKLELPDEEQPTTDTECKNQCNLLNNNLCDAPTCNKINQCIYSNNDCIFKKEELNVVNEFTITQETPATGGTFIPIAYPNEYINYNTKATQRPENYPNMGGIWVPEQVTPGNSYPLIIAFHGWISLEDFNENFFIGPNSNEQFDTIANQYLSSSKIYPIILAAPMHDIGPNKDVFGAKSFDIKTYLELIQIELAKKNIEISSLSLMTFSSSVCQNVIANSLKNINIPIYFLGLVDGTCGDTQNFIDTTEKSISPNSNKLILFHLFDPSSGAKSDIISSDTLVKTNIGSELDDPTIPGAYSKEKLLIKTYGIALSYQFKNACFNPADTCQMDLPSSKYFTDIHYILPAVLFKEMLPRFFKECPESESAISEEDSYCICSNGIPNTIQPCMRS